MNTKQAAMDLHDASMAPETPHSPLSDDARGLYTPLDGGSIMGAAMVQTLPRRRAGLPSMQAGFDLAAAKARIFKVIEETSPSKFRTFFKSDLMDKLLQTMILYFVALFQKDSVSQKIHKQGFASVVQARDLAQYEAEAHGRLAELAPIYSLIIVTQSDYVHTQKDNLFFESLYETTAQIMKEAFQSQKKVVEVEIELSRIFRTDHFNINKHKAELSNVVCASMTPIREIYALRHEGDPAINSKKLDKLFPKKQGPSVQRATHELSPIVGAMLPPPKPNRRPVSSTPKRPLLLKGMRLPSEFLRNSVTTRTPTVAPAADVAASQRSKDARSSPARTPTPDSAASSPSPELSLARRQSKRQEGGSVSFKRPSSKLPEAA